MAKHRREFQEKAIARHFEATRKWDEARNKEREDFRANDPKWQALNSNTKYQTAVASFIAAWNDAVKRIGKYATFHDVISDPAVKKWANRKSKFEIGYQVHTGEPWELANTPELFLQLIERHKLVIWRATANTFGSDTIIEDAYCKAVFMAGRNGLPIPPKLPAFPLTLAAGTSYLLELFQWALPYSERKPAQAANIEGKTRAETEQPLREMIERASQNGATWPQSPYIWTPDEETLLAFIRRDILGRPAFYEGGRKFLAQQPENLHEQESKEWKSLKQVNAAAAGPKPKPWSLAKCAVVVVRRMLKMPQNMRNDAMSQAVLILAVLAWDADAPKRHEIFNVFGPNGLTPDGHIKSVSHWVVHYELSDDGARRQWMELVRRSAAFLQLPSISTPTPDTPAVVNSGGSMVPAWMKRSDAARRLDIDPSAVTRIVKERPEIAETPDDGSRVDINALRTLIEQKNARRLHDEGIRNREAKRVTKDAQQAYEQLNETPAGRTNRQR